MKTTNMNEENVLVKIEDINVIGGKKLLDIIEYLSNDECKKMKKYLIEKGISTWIRLELVTVSESKMTLFVEYTDHKILMAKRWLGYWVNIKDVYRCLNYMDNEEKVMDKLKKMKIVNNKDL